MISKVESVCLQGMEAARVRVEVSLAKGLPRFSIVGLPDAAVREAKDRVMAAIRNSGFEFPSRRVTVNLAPADLKKEGSYFDLAIAIGILLASEAILPPKWPRCVWMGELALDGSIRPVRGALPLVRSLSRRDGSAIVLPSGNVQEVSYLEGLMLFPFSRLREATDWLEGHGKPAPLVAPPPWQAETPPPLVDLADIKGQAVGKRVLEIAAAGHHNVLFVGCPGTGKSMLAQALPSILPHWQLDEALDASQLHSLAGQLSSSGLLQRRPFRTPHHSVSTAALIGGGDTPAPGEISLAHRGVLFLDELPEFRRDALEALRQPLEEGAVHIQRTRGRASFPADFLLVSAMNPCFCGYRGHPKRECTCTPHRIQRYRSKISGPLLDRIDLQVEIPVLASDELLSESTRGESSETVRRRVEHSRVFQRRRASCLSADRLVSSAFTVNARVRGPELRRICEIDEAGKTLFKAAIERLGFSARAFDRVRRVARTIADLENSERIQAKHLAEAIQYRAFDRPPSGY